MKESEIIKYSTPGHDSDELSSSSTSSSSDWRCSGDLPFFVAETVGGRDHGLGLNK